MKLSALRIPCLMAIFSILMYLSGNVHAGVVPGDSYSNNSPSNAYNVDGYFTTDYDANIESGPGSNHSDSIPHITDTDLSTAGKLNVISFTVSSAGTYGIFDIDEPRDNSLDSFITLLDTDGTTVLAFNDDSPFDGPGDISFETWNSFLTYTFAAAGLYYLEVGSWPGATGGHPSPWSRGDDDLRFILHISLGAAPVPLPAAFWLFASGLFSLFGFKRFQKKAAELK
ncbi:MAG: hypothetical protein ABW166_00860 [Sedimenticola sp.]